jgi:hypothetical protein
LVFSIAKYAQGRVYRPYPFFILRVHTYLIFGKKAAFLLKLVNQMNPIQFTSKADLSQQIDKCQHSADLCEDAIKQLSGITPDNFVFSFSIRGLEILRFDIPENGLEFTIGFFMSWLQRYRRDIADLKKHYDIA